MLTSAQSTATTPAATTPSALLPASLLARPAARSSMQPPATPLDLSPLSHSEGSRTSLPLWAPPASPPAADPSPSPPPLSPAPAATLVALPSSSGSLPWPSTGDHYLDRKYHQPHLRLRIGRRRLRRQGAHLRHRQPRRLSVPPRPPRHQCRLPRWLRPRRQATSLPATRCTQSASCSATRLQRRGGSWSWIQTGSDHRPPRLRLASPPWSLRHRR